MVRSLKAQIQADSKRVFLDLEGFAVTETVKYWRGGTDKPPVEMNIPIVVDQDENMNSVWNKNKNQQRIGHDQAIFQKDKTFYCALEDFTPPPKKGRRIQLADVKYEVLGVEDEGGMLRIELRELEE